MKKAILFLLVTLFATSLGYTQQHPQQKHTTPQIPLKTNVIVITMPDSNGLRDKLLKFLSYEDYSLSVGRTTASVVTEAKILKSGVSVYFNFQIKGPTLVLTGRVLVPGQAAMKIAYQAKAGTPVMKGWTEMHRLAKALGGKVKYETK